MDQIEAEKFTKLIKNTNETLSGWMVGNLRSESALRAYGQAVHDFKGLAGSPFRDQLNGRLSADLASRLEEAKDTLKDPDAFLRFLVVEKAILIQAGVGSPVAELLVMQMAKVSNNVALDESIAQFGHSESETLGNMTSRLSYVLEEIKRVGSDVDRRIIALKGALQIGGWAVAVVGSSSFVGKVPDASKLPAGSLSLLPVAMGSGMITAALKPPGGPV